MLSFVAKVRSSLMFAEISNPEAPWVSYLGMIAVLDNFLISIFVIN